MTCCNATLLQYHAPHCWVVISPQTPACTVAIFVTTASNHHAPACSVLAQVWAVPLLHHVVFASQAVCHKWPQSFAVAACTQLALNYTDDVSLTEEILLEPAKIALRTERGPAGAPSHQQGTQGGSGAAPNHQQGVHGGAPQPHASVLPLSMSEKQLSLPRPEPCPGGLCVQTRWGQVSPIHNCRGGIRSLLAVQ